MSETIKRKNRNPYNTDFCERICHEVWKREKQKRTCTVHAECTRGYKAVQGVSRSIKRKRQNNAIHHKGATQWPFCLKSIWALYRY